MEQFCLLLESEYSSFSEKAVKMLMIF